MSKHLLITIPLCALMACGGGESAKDVKDEESGITLPAPTSKEFPKLNLATETILSNGAVIGMTVEEVKKLHKSDAVDSEDENYLSYIFKLGPEEYDHEYILEYAIDSDTKKVWQISFDITLPDNATAVTVYKDILDNFNAKYGKGKKTTDPDWEEYEWTATIGGQKTDITTQRMIDSEAGYILVYFEESYE